MPSLRRLGGRDRPPARAVDVPWALLDVLRDGGVALEPGGIERAGAASLRVAFVVGAFARDSTDHRTLADLARGLEAVGQQVAVFVLDPLERFADRDVQAVWADCFGPLAGPVMRGLEGWQGADIAVATSWRTIGDVLRLPGCRGRARVAFGPETDAVWGLEDTLHTVHLRAHAAPSAREKMVVVDIGVDRTTFRPLPTHRREELVLLHGVETTTLLALGELRHRRPNVELAVVGVVTELALPFPLLHLGAPAAERVAHAYASATVGLVGASLRHAPVEAEMRACGLPVVRVEHDPFVACDEVETLLDDLLLRAERSRPGTTAADSRTWEDVAGDVIGELRRALHR